MNNETMTPRQRWQAALHMQPVDRLPFWPKLGGNYPAYRKGPFADKDNDFFFEWVGADPHHWMHPCVKDVRTHSARERTQEGDEIRIVDSFKKSSLVTVNQCDKASDSWHPIEFPVKTREDILTLKEIFDDIQVEPDAEEIQKQTQAIQEAPETGLYTSVVGESPLMNWVEWQAGVENAHFLLADYPDEVEALFDAHHRYLVRRATVMADVFPGDALYMVENTSTTLISPDQYRSWCLPHLSEYARIIQADGIDVILHMCGHIKNLLPDIVKVGAQAFEAFTSPTLGNTTLLDGRNACPDTCLIGGTNAMLWTKDAETIIRQIEHDLDELPHHRGIVVTSAGVMPPICEPETIKAVGDWVKNYPIR